MDTPAGKILYIKDKKEDYLLLICQSPFKVQINYLKDPISIKTSKFVYNNIEYIFHCDETQKYYFGTKSGDVVILDQQMNLVSRIPNIACNIINVISKWNEKLVVIGDDNMVRVLNSKVVIHLSL